MLGEEIDLPLYTEKGKHSTVLLDSQGRMASGVSSQPSTRSLIRKLTGTAIDCPEDSVLELPNRIK